MDLGLAATVGSVKYMLKDKLNHCYFICLTTIKIHNINCFSF